MQKGSVGLFNFHTTLIINQLYKLYKSRGLRAFNTHQSSPGVYKLCRKEAEYGAVWGTASQRGKSEYTTRDIKIRDNINI